MEFAGTTFGSFDTVVIIILGISGILAFVRGISREVISIIALTIGIIGALFLFGRYQINVQSFIKPARLADGILLLGVFGILYTASSFLMRGWAAAIRGRKPPIADRVFGLGFGIVRGTVLASLLVLVVSNLAKDGEPADWIGQAKTYPILRKTSDALVNIPFLRAKEIAGDIKTKGGKSDPRPDVPQEEQ